MKRPIILAAIFLTVAASAQTKVSFRKIFEERYSLDSKYGIQGASIAGGKLFQLHDHNKPMVVYDIESGKFEGEIALEPVKTWHNNTASFSNVKYSEDDPYPLLYASQENILEHKAIVHRITRGEDGTLSSEIVQTIIFPEPIEMGLYYPNLALDLDSGFLYLTGFSRESWKDPARGNGVQVLRFRLPSPKEGPVVKLWTKDILARYCHDFKLATQGATIQEGKLYQVFGLPGESCLVCTDLSTGEELFKSELNGIPGEPEGLGVHQGRLVVSCGDGNVYVSDLIIK